jgi:DNA-binding transcriptional regulator YiaG
LTVVNDQYNIYKIDIDWINVRQLNSQQTKRSKPMKVAEKMKKIRLEIGLIQVEWARAIDIDTSTVCLYEQGKRHPSAKTIRRIVEFAATHGIKVKFADLVEM